MIPGLAHLALKRQAIQRPPLQGGPLPVTEDMYKRVALMPGRHLRAPSRASISESSSGLM